MHMTPRNYAGRSRAFWMKLDQLTHALFANKLAEVEGIMKGLQVVPRINRKRPDGVLLPSPHILNLTERLRREGLSRNDGGNPLQPRRCALGNELYFLDFFVAWVMPHLLVFFCPDDVMCAVNHIWGIAWRGRTCKDMEQVCDLGEQLHFPLSSPVTLSDLYPVMVM